MDEPVALGFGACETNPVWHIREAWRRLSSAGFMITAQSRFYETLPVGCIEGTPPFTNCVAVGRWPGTGLELLSLCQKIECELGRPLSRPKNASRPIDIDLLLLGETQLKLPDLVIPHPRLAERLFVLVPLAEIASEWMVPGCFRTVADLCAELLASNHGEWGHPLTC